MNQQYEDGNSDDMLVLRDLLQNIRGISPVAGSAMELGFIDDELEV